MQGLTKRQEQTLDFIRSSIEDRGYPPTLREIGEHMGIRSTNGVNDHLRALERKGYLTREDMKSRALKLVEDQPSLAPQQKLTEDDLIEVRVLGRVAAGLPLYAEENVIDTVRVDRMLVRGGREVFGLRVTGDSMIDAGILDGDFVVARQQTIADNGDIVIAGIHGEEATVKTYQRKGGVVTLLPSNPRLEPMVFPADEVEIFGRVVTVMRRL
jgi:repressor LexA